MPNSIKAKFAIAAATAALLTGCGGHGPNTYLMPKDAVVAKLTGAEREYSFFGGKDKRIVTATSTQGDVVKVRVNHTTGARGIKTCEAQVEAINEEWTRVTPVCPKGSNAEAQTNAELVEMEIDEFVIAVLYDREVDSDMVFKRTSAVIIDNVGELTAEAEREAKEAQAAYREAQVRDSFATDTETSDWGSDAGGGW